MVPEAVLPSSSIDRETISVAGKTTAPRERALGIAETWALAIALAGIIAMRLLYAFVYRVDSDEPQHLHVVWGWSHGLLPYRDLFDNHTPLFQMLCAPLLWALGEHSWIIVPMRLAMLPLFLADLWFIYLIGRTLYTQRWGLWMALIAGSIPAFFLVTTEFRTDDLWTTLWLGALWLAVSGPVIGRRAFLFGLTIGACFAVSMKTSLLLAALAVAGAGLLALHMLSRRHTGFGILLKSGALILAGLLVIPGLLIAFFAAQGALHQMAYCVILHNAPPGLGKWAKAGFHLWLFPLSLAPMLGLGWLCMHSSAYARIGSGRALLVMTCCAYYFMLRSYWPLVTAQDFTPIIPLAGLTLLAFLFHLLSLTGWPEPLLLPASGLILLVGAAAAICRIQSPLVNKLVPFQRNLAIVLHLTDPGDLVMDGKGETIFRNRPIYWVLEGITIKRIALGIIPNDVRPRMIQTGTCVALDNRLRPQDRPWLRANFIRATGNIWIAGQHLGPARPGINFHTDIKAPYSIVSTTGKLQGTLDGAPVRRTQQIPAGDHHLNLAPGAGLIVLVWTQALDRGLNPFTGKIAGFSQ